MRFPEKSELSQRARPLRFSPEQKPPPWSPPITDRAPKRFPWELAIGVALIVLIGVVAALRS